MSPPHSRPRWFPSSNEADTWKSCCSVTLRTINMDKRGYECVPFFSVYRHMISKPRKDCFVKALYLLICLRRLFSDLYSFYANLCAYSCKNLNVNCGSLSFTTLLLCRSCWPSAHETLRLLLLQLFLQSFSLWSTSKDGLLLRWCPGCHRLVLVESRVYRWIWTQVSLLWRTTITLVVVFLFAG